MRRLRVSPIWLLLACALPGGDNPSGEIAEEELRVSVAALEHAVARDGWAIMGSRGIMRS